MTTTRKNGHPWRKPGGKKPANTVIVTRPSRWSNPYTVAEYGQEQAVNLFRQWVMAPEQAAYRAKVRAELSGKVLACTCADHLPCHADVLVEVANA
ncbi:MAG: DUF4326 domain-containing protein [Tateyamaria sp.]|uniref:DUF4326 domain-containing protein n=1 Tax=Tateyamaria sp. TaxID=1929288 RepID=UPI00329E462E